MNTLLPRGSGTHLSCDHLSLDCPLVLPRDLPYTPPSLPRAFLSRSLGSLCSLPPSHCARSPRDWGAGGEFRPGGRFSSPTSDLCDKGKCLPSQSPAGGENRAPPECLQHHPSSLMPVLDHQATPPLGLSTWKALPLLEGSVPSLGCPRQGFDSLDHRRGSSPSITPVLTRKTLGLESCLLTQRHPCLPNCRLPYKPLLHRLSHPSLTAALHSRRPPLSQILWDTGAAGGCPGLEQRIL